MKQRKRIYFNGCYIVKKASNNFEVTFNHGQLIGNFANIQLARAACL